VPTPSWFNSQDVMGVSPKPCSPTANVMLVGRRNTEIKQRIRKKLIKSKSVKRKVQKSGGIYVNRREEKSREAFLTTHSTTFLLMLLILQRMSL